MLVPPAEEEGGPPAGAYLLLHPAGKRQQVRKSCCCTARAPDCLALCIVCRARVKRHRLQSPGELMQSPGNGKSAWCLVGAWHRGQCSCCLSSQCPPVPLLPCTQPAKLLGIAPCDNPEMAVLLPSLCHLPSTVLQVSCTILGLQRGQELAIVSSHQQGKRRACCRKWLQNAGWGPPS